MPIDLRGLPVFAIVMMAAAGLVVPVSNRRHGRIASTSPHSGLELVGVYRLPLCKRCVRLFAVKSLLVVLSFGILFTLPAIVLFWFFGVELNHGGELLIPRSGNGPIGIYVVMLKLAFILAACFACFLLGFLFFFLRNTESWGDMMVRKLAANELQNRGFRTILTTQEYDAGREHSTGTPS